MAGLSRDDKASVRLKNTGEGFWCLPCHQAALAVYQATKKCGPACLVTPALPCHPCTPAWQDKWRDGPRVPPELPLPQSITRSSLQPCSLSLGQDAAHGALRCENKAS